MNGTVKEFISWKTRAIITAIKYWHSANHRNGKNEFLSESYRDHSERVGKMYTI